MVGYKSADDSSVFSGSCACAQLRLCLWCHNVICLYAVSHVEIWKDEECSNDLADLLVRFSVTSSHSAYVSPRNTSFHADWHREGKNSGHRDSTLPLPFWRVTAGHAHPGRVPQRCAEVSRSDPGDVPEVIPHLRSNAAWPPSIFRPP